MIMHVSDFPSNNIWCLWHTMRRQHNWTNWFPSGQNRHLQLSYYTCELFIGAPNLFFVKQKYRMLYYASQRSAFMLFGAQILTRIVSSHKVGSYGRSPFPSLRSGTPSELMTTRCTHRLLHKSNFAAPKTFLWTSLTHLVVCAGQLSSQKHSALSFRLGIHNSRDTIHFSSHHPL